MILLYGVFPDFWGVEVGAGGGGEALAGRLLDKGHLLEESVECNEILHFGEGGVY